MTPGPRIAYGGFQFYSDWGIDEEQGRGIEPEADSGHVKRSVGLAQAFGAQHIKTRTFRRWDINARMIAEAHRRGMRATGHCATQLPLIAAGMDAKEHIGFCSTRGAGFAVRIQRHDAVRRPDPAAARGGRVGRADDRLPLTGRERKRGPQAARRRHRGGAIHIEG